MVMPAPSKLWLRFHRWDDPSTKTPLPRVTCAPGARGYAGEGWVSDLFLGPLGKFALKSPQVSLACKTITVEARQGNMPLDKLSRPTELFPRCVWVDLWSQTVVNAVGLSNLSAEWHFKDGLWTAQTEPFYLSLGFTGATREARVDEAARFATIALRYLSGFKARVALHVDFGCPNTLWIKGASTGDATQWAEEIEAILDALMVLDIPLIPGFSPIAPIAVIKRVSRHPACAALWLGNTIPWEHQEAFPITQGRPSPLIARGFEQPGGISSPIFFPLTLKLVQAIRIEGIRLPIIAGRGIAKPNQARELLDEGADVISVGTVATTRPWDVPKIIRAAYR